jgi:CDP-glycerol glycerophosphotransferase (TagB/SpsB family)
MNKKSSLKLVLCSIGALLFLPFWYIQKLFPRDRHIWLFGSWFGKKYSDNSRALYEYVIKNEPTIKPVWITHSKDVYRRLSEEGKPVKMSNSLSGIISCLRAGIVFITTTPDEMNAKYLNGTYTVWLWHGVGLKYIMADEERFLWEHYSSFKKFKVKINRFLFPYRDKPKKDSVLNTGDFFSRFFMSGFELNKDQVWVDGYPRNDFLFSSGRENIVSKYKTLFPTARFIIYMPTHRFLARKGVPFNGFDGFGFDKDEFFKSLESNDYVFFNKGHFYDADADIEIKNERFVNLTDRDFDNLYLLIKDMDILITDFSSVYFDFLLTSKPIILAPFDFDDYVTNERTLQFDYNEQKSVQAHNWPELISILNQKTFASPSEEEVAMFHNHKDGKSSERLVSRLKYMFHLKN